MGQIATGYCHLETRDDLDSFPKKLDEYFEDEYSEYYHCHGTITFTIDGNYWVEEVVNDLEKLAPYIKSGEMDFEGDEDGHCRAKFANGKWFSEQADEIFYSELPNDEIVSTKRVAEILDRIAEDLMCMSDSEHARELFFTKCKLSESETKLFGLEWLKDLEGET